MPVVKVTKAVPAVKGKVVVGGKKRTSTLDEAKPTDTATREGTVIRALLSGASGGGKTTSATTVIDINNPEEKALLIDFDGRSESVAGFPGIEVVRCIEEDPRSPKAWLRAERIRKDLWTAVQTAAKLPDETKRHGFPWSAVIADSLTEIFSIAMNWSLTLNPKRGLGGCPAEHHWMPQMHNVKLWVKSILALPCHVVITCHEDFEKSNEDGLFYFLPKATGKLRTEIPKWFNETYYCWRQMDPKPEAKGKHAFYWKTQGSGRREYLKSSLNQLGRYWKDPIQLDFSSDKPVGFQDLLGRRFGTIGRSFHDKDETKKEVIE